MNSDKWNNRTTYSYQLYQYKKVQDYVTNFKNNDSDKYAEFLKYKQSWFNRYKSTDQLFNDLKQYVMKRLTQSIIFLCCIFFNF